METKEITMQKRTKLLGAAGVAAAMLVGAPASAGTLTDFAGDVFTSYGTSDLDKLTDNINSTTFGGTVAAPLSDIPNMNVQAGGAYTHSWAGDTSQANWDFNGAVFWAGPDSRLGINVNYTTYTHSGNDTGFGVFGEMYFGMITGGLKAGWLQSGGSGGCQMSCPAGATRGPLLPSGGSGGGYLGANATVYAMPNLAITGVFDYQNQNHGFANVPIGRIGVHHNTYLIEGEYLVDQEWAPAVFANIGFTHLGTSSQGGTTAYQDVTTWHIGLRWYTGGGTLVDKHRNGTLRSVTTGR